MLILYTLKSFETQATLQKKKQSSLISLFLHSFPSPLQFAPHDHVFILKITGFVAFPHISAIAKSQAACDFSYPVYFPAQNNRCPVST